MNTLSTISCGWKWLNGVLNALVTAINQRTVVAGTGIAVNETPSGVMISLSGSSTTSSAGTSDGGAGPIGGTWITIDVMDSSCNRSTIQVWSKPG